MNGNVETVWLEDSSAATSVKRILLAPSNFATYYPSKWTMYLGQNISKETNQFLKESPDAMLGPCSWYIEIHHFLMVKPLYLPIKGYIVRQLLHDWS